MSIRRWFVLPVVALMSLVALSFGSTGSVAQEVSPTEKVLVLKMNEYTVKRGDHLTGVAGRFGVSMESILESNQNVAKRTLKGKRHWLYAGERITVPTYIAKQGTLNNAGDADLVGVQAGYLRSLGVTNADLKNQLEAAKQSNAALQNENAALRGQYDKQRGISWMLVAFAAIILLLLVFAATGRRTDEDESETRAHAHDHEPGAAKAALTGETNAGKCCQPVTPARTARTRIVKAETLVEKARNAKGSELKKFVEMELVKDECGNAVTIKKAKEFINKRPGLEDKTLNDWDSTCTRKDGSPAECCNDDSKPKAA